MTEYTLSEEFLAEHRQMAAEFDKLAEDLFKGSQMEQLALKFFRKHINYIKQFPFTWKSKFPNQSSNETIDEDLEIISDGMGKKDVQDLEPPGPNKKPKYAQIVGDIYRRLSEGSYLRLTYNKSRLNQEDDRMEPVEWARYALRYDNHSFEVCGWYMIALGWYLDVLKNPKERALVSAVFRQSTLRCIWINPEEPLAHNLLGRYYLSVANLTWIERAVAKNLLGCKIEGTFKDAEREFLRAHELKNDWLPTGLWLARVLLAQKRPLDEVKGWIDFGLSLGSKEPSTEIERLELLDLKAKLKLCN